MSDFDIFDDLNKLDEVKFRNMSANASQQEYDAACGDLQDSGSIRTTWENLDHVFGRGYTYQSRDGALIVEWLIQFEGEVIVSIEATIPQEEISGQPANMRNKIKREPRDWDVFSNDERGHTYMKWLVMDRADRDDKEQKPFERKAMGEFDIFEKLDGLNKKPEKVKEYYAPGMGGEEFNRQKGQPEEDAEYPPEDGSTVDLVGRVTEDGYLLAAEYEEKFTGRDSYWPDYYSDSFAEGDLETVRLSAVPHEIAKKLVAMGSDEQDYSDGYEAWDAARPFYEDAEGNDPEGSSDTWTTREGCIGKKKKDEAKEKYPTCKHCRNAMYKRKGEWVCGCNNPEPVKKVGESVNEIGDHQYNNPQKYLKPSLKLAKGEKGARAVLKPKDSDEPDEKKEGLAMHMFSKEYDKLTSKQQGQVDDGCDESIEEKEMTIDSEVNEQDENLLKLRMDANSKALVVLEKGDGYVVTNQGTAKTKKEVACSTVEAARKAVDAWQVKEFANVKTREVGKEQVIGRLEEIIQLIEEGEFGRDPNDFDRNRVLAYLNKVMAEAKLNELEEHEPPDVSALMDYEDGQLDARTTLKLFSQLISSGLAWKLQGSVYGRPAARLIELGYIDKEGNILKYPEEDEDEYNDDDNEFDEDEFEECIKK
jgi:hypothetical protein